MQLFEEVLCEASACREPYKFGWLEGGRRKVEAMRLWWVYVGSVRVLQRILICTDPLPIVHEQLFVSSLCFQSGGLE